MAKAYDVPADELISKLAGRLKKDKKIHIQAGLLLSKPVHIQKKFLKIKTSFKCVPFLRKVYIHGPI